MQETVKVEGIDFKKHTELERMSHESETDFRDRFQKRFYSIRVANMPDKVHTKEILSEKGEIQKAIFYIQKS